jgi:hypothetical protein
LNVFASVAVAAAAICQPVTLPSFSLFGKTLTVGRAISRATDEQPPKRNERPKMIRQRSSARQMIDEVTNAGSSPAAPPLRMHKNKPKPVDF